MVAQAQAPCRRERPLTRLLALLPQLGLAPGPGGYIRSGHISDSGIPAGTDAERDARFLERAAGCSEKEDKSVHGR